METLGAIDRGILRLLEENARHTITAMAGRLNVSDSTVRNHLNRLEEEGVVERYAVELDYERAGLPLRVLFVCTGRVSAREELVRKVVDVPGVVHVRELMTGTENVHIVAVGREHDDITRTARRIDEIGLDISTEELLKHEFRKSPFEE